MKKSMLNVITLALVLINLVLTVILTFSLVSTNNKTNTLIGKVAEIIDLDVAGVTESNTGSSSSIADITYVDVTNGDDTDIIVSFIENSKTRYAVLTVSLGLDTKAKDYETVSTAVTNGMKVVVNEVTNEANKYTYSTISASKATIEANLLATLQDTFQTETITSVLVTMVIQ